MAGLRFPLSTLHVQPRGYPRMTRGRDGAAIPFTWGSFIPYSMPVYPGAFIAVGTPVTGRPPHRSVREELPHTAPTLGLVTRSLRFGYGCRIFAVGTHVLTNRLILSHVRLRAFWLLRLSA